MDVAELGLEKARLWRNRPGVFVREVFGATPDLWQDDVLEAFPDAERLAMVACKGPGKTCVDAWLIWNYLTTHRDSQIAVVSITGDNLRDGLWKELGYWLGESPFLRTLFEWRPERIVSRERPEAWWVSARKWSKTADRAQQARALSGLHAKHCMFVLDESAGIPQAVMATAEAVLASGRKTKLLQSGNPDVLDGPLHRAATVDKSQWKVFHISGDPEDPKRAPRVDLEWAKAQIKQYGRDNPWVKVNVFGEFPEQSMNALLGIEDVNAAMRRQLQPAVYEWAQKRIGVDVARYGDDRTVLFPRQGRRAFNPRVERFARGASVSTEIANIVVAAKTKWGCELEVMDATGGWAAGARDVLVASGYSPLEIQFHGKALDPRYENRRAEMWFSMAEWVKKGAQLPNVDDLVAELTAPTYTFSRTGKLLIEPKDLVKERIMRSPDLADALALTFGQPEMPRGVGRRPGRALRAGEDEGREVSEYTEQRFGLRRRVRPEPFDAPARAVRAGDDEE